MSEWRKRSATAAAGLGLIACAAGCGNAEKALTLPQVKASMNAVGLKDLHVLSHDSIVAEVAGRSLPGIAFNVESQPEYLQDRKRPGLLVVRIPKLDQARRVVSKSRTERGGGFTIRMSRVCNVLVVNYLANRPSYAALASRAETQLRRRCR
jgi:hypothetical protein